MNHTKNASQVGNTTSQKSDVQEALGLFTQLPPEKQAEILHLMRSFLTEQGDKGVQHDA